MDVVEEARRVVTLEYRVAERTGEAVEDRGVHEEVDHPAGERLHQLVADVLDDVAVVARERLRRGDQIRLAPKTERREVEAGRPSLGPLDEDPGDRRVGVDPGEGQERGGFRIRHREVVGVELEQGSGSPGAAAARGAARAGPRTPTEEPGGTCSATKRRTSSASFFTTWWTSSRTSTNGRDAWAKMSRRVGSDGGSALRVFGGWTDRAASKRSEISTAGSLCTRESRTQAAGRGSSSAHCASNVDLPEPARASTQIGRSPAVCSPSTSRGRSTHSGRTAGTANGAYGEALRDCGSRAHSCAWS